MKNEVPLIKRIYTTVFSVSVIMLIIMILFLTDFFDQSFRDHIRDFSDAWVLENGETVFIDNVKNGDYGGKVTLFKQLPMDVCDNDSLCFESNNANLKVFIEGQEIYNFKSEKNISGYGYGIVFHELGLSKAYVGRTVEIEFEGVYEGFGGAGISKVYISPADDYIHFKLIENAPGAVSSLIIGIFGMMLLFSFFFVRNGKDLPFDIAALGITSFVMGLWLFIDTNVPQILYGDIYVWRVLHRIIIFFVAFPLVAFFNSLTEHQRGIYHHVSLTLSVFFLATLLISRYFFGIDMIDSFATIISAYLSTIVVVIFIIFVDNSAYCRRKGVEQRVKYVFIGTAVLMVSALIDLFIYEKKLIRGDSFGTFTRIGMMLFIGIMITNFLSWWSKDQVLIGRDRFVNKIMHYAISSNSPDDIISSILEYIGKELKVGRLVIFEDQGNGKFHGSYQWCREDKDPGAIDLLYLPYKGFVEDVEKTFEVTGNRLVVSDIEEYKNSNQQLYNLLKSNHIENMVASPLKINQKLMGMITLLELPHGLLSEASEIIGLTSYFLSQLLLRRDEDKRLRTFIYNDSLAGTLNRRAYKEFIEEKLDLSSPFGYFVCIIQGLENANKMLGFDSGDKMVIETSNYLTEVFGKENVFRISGSKLVAFGFESEEVFFQNDIERFKKQISEVGVKLQTGAVYCIYGAKDINVVINKANELCYQDGK